MEVFVAGTILSRATAMNSIKFDGVSWASMIREVEHIVDCLSDEQASVMFGAIGPEHELHRGVRQAWKRRLPQLVGRNMSLPAALYNSLFSSREHAEGADRVLSLAIKSLCAAADAQFKACNAGYAKKYGGPVRQPEGARRRGSRRLMHMNSGDEEYDDVDSIYRDSGLRRLGSRRDQHVPMQGVQLQRTASHELGVSHIPMQDAQVQRSASNESRTQYVPMEGVQIQRSVSNEFRTQSVPMQGVQMQHPGLYHAHLQQMERSRQVRHALSNWQVEEEGVRRQVGREREHDRDSDHKK